MKDSVNLKHLNRLDHLRVFACIGVALCHFFDCLPHSPECTFVNTSTIWHQTILALFDSGKFGVDLFFVLSAFLFTVLSQGGSARIIYHKFLFNRILRIFPVFFVVTAVLLSVMPDFKMDDLFAMLFATPKENIPMWTFGVLWTLKLEIKFYLLCPILLQILHKKGIGVFVGGIICCILLRFGITIVQSDTTNFMVWRTIVGRCDQFLIGIIFGFLYVQGHFKCFKATWLANIGCILLSVIFLFYIKLYSMFVTKNNFLILTGTIQGLFFGMVIVCYSYSSFFSNKYSHNILVWLSQYTYSFYVFHVFVMYTLAHFFRDYIPKGFTILLPAMFLIFFPITLLFSMLVRKCIEEPFLEFKVNYFKDKEPKIVAK